MTLITINETMRRLSIGRSTVYRLINEGRLISVLIRGSRRIRLDSVDSLGVSETSK